MKILKSYKLFFCFIILFINSCAYATSSPIEVEYRSKVVTYNLALAKQDYVSACSIAESLLSMDPSDTLSLLRLAYCSKMLNNQYKKSVNSHMHTVSRSTKQDLEIIDFIEAIKN